MIELLHRDARVLAIHKPSGLLVHRGWGRDAIVAVDLVQEAIGAKVYPVHRLDRGASGVLLLALDREAAALLHGAIERGEMDKRYLVLVRGRPPDQGVIDHAIPRREGGPRVPARTDFRTLCSAGNASLVEARLRTGRLHQVRRHLKHIGHPVLGDANYGKGALNRELRDRVGLCRLGLHAVSVSFVPPGARAPMSVHAALPADLAVPLARLGLCPP